MIDRKIGRGKVLLAEPFMMDSNFKRSVVLVCEHEEEGSLGFILNKSLKMKINDLVSEFPDIESFVYYGGPVQTDTIHYIHTAGHLLEDSEEIMPGVFWGGDFEKLKILISNKLIKADNIRFFIGYSGWSESQLKGELKLGSWVIAEMDLNYLFKVGERDLWSKVMKHKGDVFSVLANVPEEITWN
ncbi:MAG: YqgE/AlgH family protein [Saprospiraceae bacterium]|jgi:putative transcriptional regulator|nr:YqgE/AlgH family protein [Saprospiraceae bacterium]